MLQYIIATALLLVSLNYVFKRVRGAFATKLKGKDGGCSGCGCGKAK